MTTRILASITLCLIGTVACHPRQPRHRPTGDVTCPDGFTRPRVDCSTELGLKERVVSANARLGQTGLGIGASYEERAVGQVTDSTYQLALRLESLCKDYNGCVMSADAYASEAQRIRTQIDQHLSFVGRLDEGPSIELGDAIWANARPDLAGSRLSVDYRIEARSRSSGSTFVHTDGAPLASGDAFRIVVRTNQPTYLYVLLLASQGVPSQLFPLPEMNLQNPLPAGVEVTIPNDGTFELDAVPGEESFQILASPHPLPDIEARLSTLGQAPVDEARRGMLDRVGSLLCDGNTRGVKYTKATATCEGRATRGVVYKKATEIATIAARPNDDVIVIQHRIDHR